MALYLFSRTEAAASIYLFYVFRSRPQPAPWLKKRLWHRCFPVNFAKFLNTFFHRTPLVAAFKYSTWSNYFANSLLKSLHCIRIWLKLRELFLLFILVSAVTMEKARAKMGYDFKFKQAVIKNIHENRYWEAARKYSMKLRLLFEGGFYLLFFHLNFSFYLRAASIRETMITNFFFTRKLNHV